MKKTYIVTIHNIGTHIYIKYYSILLPKRCERKQSKSILFILYACYIILLLYILFFIDRILPENSIYFIYYIIYIA